MGAIDRKHVVIQASARCDSAYLNYKQKVPEKSETFTFVTIYGLNKTLLLQTRSDKQGNQTEGQVPTAIIADFEIFQVFNGKQEKP